MCTVCMYACVYVYMFVCMYVLLPLLLLLGIKLWGILRRAAKICECPWEAEHGIHSQLLLSLFSIFSLQCRHCLPHAMLQIILEVLSTFPCLQLDFVT